jgi:general secretion pathway protein C
MHIDRLAKRWYPALLGVLLATLAYFQARGIDWLVGAFIAGDGRVSRPVSSSSPSVTSAALPVSVSAVPLTLAPEPSALPSEILDPLSWPPCEGVQVMVVSESGDPWWSMTTLRKGGEPRGRLHRVGDDVAGRQVAFIGFNPRQQVPSVWLEGRGAPCQSSLFREVPALAASPQAVLKPRIQRDSETDLRIDRAVVEKTLEDPSAAVRSVRVVPERKDGTFLGLRLFGIRPTSLLGTLGLRNGDRLESINGFNVGDPEKALEAYARLRLATHLDIRLNRAGVPVEVRINIE